MTKVGIYAIIRVYTLVFPPDLETTGGLYGMWLLPAALIGLLVGMTGVLGAKRLDRLVAFSVIGSMGMLTVSVAQFTPAGISAGLYYAIHSALATGALFLIVDLVRSGRGAAGVDLRAAMPVIGGAMIAPLFFVAAIAMTGLPPLSGFVGKLLILNASFDTPLVWLTWAVILGSSLIAVVGFSRAGSVLFWKAHQIAGENLSEDAPEDAQGAAERHDPRGHIPILELVSVGGLLALLVVHTVLAGPITRYMTATTAQLFAPGPYIEAVLSVPGKDLSKDPHHEEEDQGDESKDGQTEDSHGDDAEASHGAAPVTEGGH
jgi:multicomponent K+:H+ antiporter subunit D